MHYEKPERKDQESVSETDAGLVFKPPEKESIVVTCCATEEVETTCVATGVEDKTCSQQPETEVGKTRNNSSKGKRKLKSVKQCSNSNNKSVGSSNSSCTSESRTVSSSMVLNHEEEDVIISVTEEESSKTKVPKKQEETSKNTEDQNKEAFNNNHKNSLRSKKTKTKMVMCTDEEEKMMASMILPEKEEYKIELIKGKEGLGITVAGYVCEKGNFVSFLTYLFTNKFMHGFYLCTLLALITISRSSFIPKK